MQILIENLDLVVFSDVNSAEDIKTIVDRYGWNFSIVVCDDETISIECKKQPLAGVLTV